MTLETLEQQYISPSEIADDLDVPIQFVHGWIRSPRFGLAPEKFKTAVVVARDAYEAFKAKNADVIAEAQGKPSEPAKVA
jgi:hypothetical protein